MFIKGNTLAERAESYTSQKWGRKGYSSPEKSAVQKQIEEIYCDGYKDATNQWSWLVQKLERTLTAINKDRSVSLACSEVTIAALELIEQFKKDLDC